MEKYKCLGSFNINTRHNSLNILGEIRILGKWKEVRILINGEAINIGFINANYAKT